ncbi:MAG: MarR family winged helix-turn-helix transcriptional regulator [Saprospiraceae bacterium]
MGDHIFNPDAQLDKVEFRIVAALERLSEAFRVLLWDQAKVLNVSPIQIQLLIFLRYHKPEYATVSKLAEEFNMTRPTISDAVRALEQKGLVERDPNPADARSHTLVLTDAGRAVAEQTANFASPLLLPLELMDDEQKYNLLENLLHMILNLQRKGVVSLHRMCFNCQNYMTRSSGHYCRLLAKKLENKDLQIDCPVHVPH